MYPVSSEKRWRFLGYVNSFHYLQTRPPSDAILTNLQYITIKTLVILLKKWATRWRVLKLVISARSDENKMILWNVAASALVVIIIKFLCVITMLLSISQRDHKNYFLDTVFHDLLSNTTIRKLMKRTDAKIQEKLQFSFCNIEKQVECRKTTTEEVSFDWSHLVKKSMIVDSSPVSNALTSLPRLWKLNFKTII